MLPRADRASIRGCHRWQTRWRRRRCSATSGRKECVMQRYEPKTRCWFFECMRAYRCIVRSLHMLCIKGRLWGKFMVFRNEIALFSLLKMLYLKFIEVFFDFWMRMIEMCIYSNNRKIFGEKAIMEDCRFRKEDYSFNLEKN